jgi:hypothetical protein
MFNSCKNLAFVTETPDGELVRTFETDQLDSDAFPELAIRTSGEIDRPHAAASHFLLEAICADATAEGGLRRIFIAEVNVDQGLDGNSGALHKVARIFGGEQKRVDLAPELVIIAAAFAEKSFACLAFQGESRNENGLNLPPAPSMRLRLSV